MWSGKVESIHIASAATLRASGAQGRGQGARATAGESPALQKHMGDITLRELVYGRGAHVDPMACVEDISARVATRTVAGYPHSIWQIVEHMNYWMEYEVRRIAGNVPSYPEHAIESWPPHPEPAGEPQWSAIRKQFADLLSRLAELADSDSPTFEKTVLPDKPSLPPSTVGAVVKQITAHNSYHVGQIAMLRRQLDEWPPLRGGDSW